MKQAPPHFTRAISLRSLQAAWVLSLAVSAGLAATPAQAALAKGEVAPEFTVPASQAGKAFRYSLKDQLKKGPVVVFFYPAAFTDGCSLQAHSFAVNQAQFAQAGASIVGVSLDSIQRLNEFSADPDSCAGKIPVASDQDGAIAKAYALAVHEASTGSKDARGVNIDHGMAERTTFVIAPNGRIHATLSGLEPIENVDQSLAVVQKLAGAHR